LTYQYNVSKYQNKPIQGIFDNYQTDQGVYVDVDLRPRFYYTSIDNLININWIDDMSRSVIFSTTFYNINMRCFFSVKILFEKTGVRFKGSVDYGFVGSDQSILTTSILCIIFSVLNILCLVYSLKKSNHEKKLHLKKLKQEKEQNEQENENKKVTEVKIDDLNTFQLFCHKVKIWFTTLNENYIKIFNYPNFFQCLVFTSFLFIYCLIIARVDYYKQFDDLAYITDHFIDIDNLVSTFNIISHLSSLSILILLFPLINHMGYWIEGFSIIVSSIESVSFICYYIYKLFITTSLTFKNSLSHT